MYSDRGPSSPYSLAGLQESAMSLVRVPDIPVPSIIECNDIPDDRDEIPTPNTAQHQNVALDDKPKIYIHIKIYIQID